MKVLGFLIVILSSSFGLSQTLPKPFLSEITTQFPNVRDFAMSPDGNEIMFTAQSVMGNVSAIISIKKQNDVWGSPQIASFSGMHFDLEPFFSLDGLKLYFVSRRPLNNTQMEPKDFDIWYVERSNLNDNWSEPINMGSPINTEHGEFYPSLSINGNLYFTRDDTTLTSKDDIYVCTFENGNYQKPQKLNTSINTDGYEYNAFIAPDESYLLFGSYNREGGFGSGDLYISFNTTKGWTLAKNLGESVNSDKMDYCPFVDTKTNTLYFTSKRDSTKTSFDSPMTIEAFLLELHKADNGLSRLYSVPLKLE